MESKNGKEELKFKEGKKEIFYNLVKEFNNLTNEYSVKYKYDKIYTSAKIRDDFNTYLEKNDINQLVDWVRTNFTTIQKRNLGIVGKNTNNLEKAPEIFNFIKNKEFSVIKLTAGFNSTGVLSPVFHFLEPKIFAIVNTKALDLLSCFFNDNNVTNDWENYKKSSEFIIKVGKVIKGDKKDDIAETIYFDRFAHWFSKKYGSHEIDTLNTIFYGPPGTGKTFNVNKRLEFLISENPKNDKAKYIEKVVFHPNYGYEDFIDGIKPTGFVNGQIKLELVNGHFKQFCINVHNKNLGESDKTKLPKYYFVVDEINRANLAAVFGETLMLLEDSYRYVYSMTPEENEKYGKLITLKNSKLCTTEENKFEEIVKEKQVKVLFGIPENIYFIGMMNDVDRSIDSFDLALRRRFAWIEMKCDFDALRDDLEDYTNLKQFIECCENLNSFIINKDKLGLSESFQLGHAIYMNIKKTVNSRKTINKENCKDFFQKYIYGTVREYLRTEYPENEIKEKLDEALKEFLKPFTPVETK